MIKSLWLENFGPFSILAWPKVAPVNIIVGANDTGKSLLLKLLYAVSKADEQYIRRSTRASPWPEHLAAKLLDVFLPDAVRLGRLTKRRQNKTTIRMTLDTRRLGVVWHRNSLDRLSTASSTDLLFPHKVLNTAVFIPPKEVLTIRHSITLSRDEYFLWDFDDTYYDLVKLLSRKPGRGSRAQWLAQAMKDLNVVIDGEFLFGEEEEPIIYRKGTARFEMPQTAEGIKKLGMLIRLIQNRSIDHRTLLFFDEPESNLHPRAIRVLVSVLYQLAKAGVQVFMATHSYFVLKACEILARRSGTSSLVCSLKRQAGAVTGESGDLRKGIPDNEIVSESLAMLDDDLRVRMDQ